MAKLSGNNAAILINGYNLSVYGRKYQIDDATPPLDVTGFTEPRNFVPGQREGKVTIEMMWDSDTGKTMSVLSAPGTGHITIVPEGLAVVGGTSYSLAYMQSNFSPASAQNEVLSIGSVEFVANGASNDGVEDGQLVYSGTITATNTGSTATPVDAWGARTAACSGTLHITQLCAADRYVVKIQHSANGTTGWADLVTFTLDGSAVGAQKVNVASGAVYPYRRITATRTGTAGNSFTFHVHFRHAVGVAYP